MLSKEPISYPTRLLDLALKKGPVPVAVINAHEALPMQSSKEAFEMGLIQPTLIGKDTKITSIAKNINWNLKNIEIINTNSDQDSVKEGAVLAKENKVKIIIKGHIHTDAYMENLLKREFRLISKRRISHIWHMSKPNSDKSIIITDGAVNILPKLETKMDILLNAVEFAHKIGIQRPKISILSGSEDVRERMPSSIDADKLTKKAQTLIKNADVFGPLAFDNTVSLESASIKGIKNKVAGNADIILVPNIETGNALVKMMVYYMSACAAGVVVGAKVPFVLTSRSDGNAARLASIAAAVICA